MKCDKLKAYELRDGAYGMYLAIDGWAADVDFGSFVYMKDDADKVIEDLEESHKKEVEQLLIEIVELKERISEERSKKVDYKISANDLSDGLREALDENRKLKRALWLARASMCKMEKDQWSQHIEFGICRNRKGPVNIKKGKLLTVTQWRELWANNESKCRAKAEVFA